MSTCSVLGCTHLAKSRGFCGGHYQRWAAGKSLDSVIAERLKAKGIKCTVETCMNTSWSKGLCRFHDSRSRRGFPVDCLDLPINYRSELKRGWIHKGYRWICLDGGREVMEHRHIMETLLGRKLGYDEVVHHKDENKLNNDLSNLELLTRSKHQSQHRNKQLRMMND